MENYAANTYDLYHDIQARTGGEIYIGVLGPVRTGKSTFIKRFMDVMVLPYIENEHDRVRAQDELPQSAGGKTITTTEPKFIPKEAAKISLNGDIDVAVRLIDCVGYMVDGAAGHLEENAERMVKTPWFDHEVPFTQAAEIGTDKVMNDHSTIGLVITTDGSFGEIPRNSFVAAEEKTISALKKLHKPFLVLLNSQRPFSEDTRALATEIAEKYDVSVLPVNCEQLKKDDIHMILENILYEFPISVMEFYMPKWVEMLPTENRMKQEMIGKVKDCMKEYNTVRDAIDKPLDLGSEFVKRTKTDSVKMSDGSVKVNLDVDESYYYEMLTDMIGEDIQDEYQLLGKLKEFSAMKREYAKVLNAVNMVRMKGYGVVTPEKTEITLNSPELIKHGNKFGVKIKAFSPSIHMIRANIETEIAPIVGTEDQAEDLIRYINNADTSEEGIWDTNIFGKTVEQLVNDGITSKITSIGDDSQLKLQDTMQKIVNDSNGGMVCIII
ncbi:MAG: stage IV sporulation protein A [Clostridium sp.]|jgi:stage IV sporulation protein A|nr:stage IV sporulation protein A [Clostridium sp.]